MILLLHFIIISTAVSTAFTLPVRRQFVPNAPALGVIPAANMMAFQQGFNVIQPQTSNPVVGGNPFQAPGLAQQGLSMFMQNPAPISHMTPSTLGSNSQTQVQDLSSIAQWASSMGQTLQGTVNTLSSAATAWSQVFNTLGMQQLPQPGQVPPNYSQQPSIQMAQQQYLVPGQQPGLSAIQQPPAQQQAPAYGRQGPGQVPNYQLFTPQPNPSQGQQQGAQVQSFGGMGKMATQHAAIFASGRWPHTAAPKRHSKAKAASPAGAQRKVVHSTNQVPTRFHKVKAHPNRHMFKMLHRQKLDRQDDDDGW